MPAFLGKRKISSQDMFKSFVCVLLFVLGYSSIYFSDKHVMGVMKKLEGSEISCIALVEKRDSNGYLLRILEADKDTIGKAYLDTESEFGSGDVIEVQGQCFLYEGAANPGEFSYMNYMKSCGIFFKIGGISQRSSVNTGWWDRFLSEFYSVSGQISQVVLDRIGQLFGKYSSLVEGMVIGDTSRISRQDIELYRQAGIGHFFAVSGLHIGMLAAGIGWIFGLLGVGRGGRAVAMSIATTMLLVMCGFTPSSLRAAFMLAMSALAFLVMRRSETITTVCLSAAISLLLQPHLMYNTGFILSHGAIACFSLVNGKILSPIKQGIKRKCGDRAKAVVKAMDLLMVPLCFWIVTTPMSGTFFGTVSTYGAITNLLCSGLFSMAFGMALSVLLISLVSISFASVAANVVRIVLSLMKTICQWIVGLPYSSMPGVNVPILVYVALFLPLMGLCVSVFSPEIKRKDKGEKGRYVMLVCVKVAVFMAFIQLMSTSTVQVTYLSVGQGDSSVIRFRNGAVMVVDGGTAAGGRSLENYLKKTGTERIDALVLSHGHSDHGGGFELILDQVAQGNMYVGRLYVSEADRTKLAQDLCLRAEEEGIPVVRLAAGDEFFIGGCEVDVIWPVAGHPVLEVEENNYSMVLNLQVGQDSFIFTGDIESQVESFIIDSVRPCSVLKVPHHGSDTSSHAQFIQALSPDFCVISVGKNSYGHPSDRVVDMMAEMGGYLHITYTDGALVIQSDGRGCRIVNWKGLWGLRN